VARTEIALLCRQFEASYRTDPFHALRKNIEAVGPEEWFATPAGDSARLRDEWGEQPELAISDLVEHLAGAKFMYADHAFGPGTMNWGDIRSPGRERGRLLDWLDEGHALFAAGLAALEDDAALQEECPWPGRPPIARGLMVQVMINHDLYHSGEINRQRALLRGSDGWRRDERDWR